MISIARASAAALLVLGAGCGMYGSLYLEVDEPTVPTPFAEPEVSEDDDERENEP